MNIQMGLIHLYLDQKLEPENYKALVLFILQNPPRFIWGDGQAFFIDEFGILNYMFIDSENIKNL